MEVLVRRGGEERTARVSHRVHDEGDVPRAGIPPLLQPHPSRHQERQHPRWGRRDRQDRRLWVLRAAHQREPVALLRARDSLLGDEAKKGESNGRVGDRRGKEKEEGGEQWKGGGERRKGQRSRFKGEWYATKWREQGEGEERRSWTENRDRDEDC